MNTIHAIYNTIKRIRLEKGFSQAYMADQLSMFQGNYGKLENGKIQITIERLEKIAEVFGMTVLELLAGHEQGTQKNQIDFLKEINNTLSESAKTFEMKYLQEKVSNNEKDEYFLIFLNMTIELLKGLIENSNVSLEDCVNTDEFIQIILDKYFDNIIGDGVRNNLENLKKMIKAKSTV